MDNLHRELLKIEDLTVDFSTRQGMIHAVRGVNFQLNTREILGIVGESRFRKICQHVVSYESAGRKCRSKKRKYPF